MGTLALNAQLVESHRPFRIKTYLNQNYTRMSAITRIVATNCSRSTIVQWQKPASAAFWVQEQPQSELLDQELVSAQYLAPLLLVMQETHRLNNNFSHTLFWVSPCLKLWVCFVL